MQDNVPPTLAVFSPIDPYLLYCAAPSADAPQLLCYDFLAQQVIHTVTLGPHVPYSLAISADGTRLAVGSQDRVVTLLAADAEDVVPLAEMGGFADVVSCVAFSPDGRKVLAGSVGEVHMLALSP